MFLSLTDYVQHKYATTEVEAKRFYQDLDLRFGRLAGLGALVALTADHGMNDKSTPEGKPNVIWLQDVLDAKFGAGDTTVNCPKTDAILAHHVAHGGFVRVYCRGKTRPEQVIELVRGIEGIESVYDKDTACRLLDLPADREGDVVVISTAGVCVGAPKPRPVGGSGYLAAHSRQGGRGEGADHPERAAQRRPSSSPVDDAGRATRSSIYQRYAAAR
jgi:phosphonoacetate hydrolase